MNKKLKMIMGVLALFGLALVIGFVGCARLQTFLNSASTKLTSSSLVAASALRAQGITIAGSLEGDNWIIPPTGISGKVLSVVLPVNDQEDEGIVPFGDGRPDIAPAQATLYDFDLSEITTLSKDSIGIKPGFVGGNCEQILLIFGYFDVEFLQGASTKKIRMCYGDSDAYTRGDKLLLNAEGETTDSFYWYNTTSSAFVVETDTRPDYPSVNELVRDFSDSVRPNMHYYLLGAQLTNNTDYDGAQKDYITLSKAIVEDNDLSFTVDFDMQNTVVFTSCTSEAQFEALSDAELIEKFDMKQNVSGWGDTELYCSVSFEATPKF